MKKILIFSFTMMVFLTAMAQEETPNANAQMAADKYEKRLSEHESTMGTTVHNTYEARDPRQEKIDERKDRREDKRELKRQLQLERARRSNFLDRRRNPWVRTYPYGF